MINEKKWRNMGNIVNFHNYLNIFYKMYAVILKLWQNDKLKCWWTKTAFINLYSLKIYETGIETKPKRTDSEIGTVKNVENRNNYLF